MPNVRLIAGFLFVVFTHVTHATAVVSVVGGRVIDIDTGESLPFAKVRIDDSTRVATANQDGQFTLLDVPVGSTLVVTKMGFDSNNVVVHPNTRRLTVNLSKYEDSFIEEVVVTGAIPQMMQQSGLSQVSLSPELTKTLPNLGEQDIFRSMQLSPGVAGSNESSSGLAVRGGTVDQNLVLFDDAIKHCCRIARIIKNPGGHALLVGVGGSGKQSLSLLSSFICGFSVYQITINQTYSMSDLK